MEIIVWGINYAPELTGIAPFNTGLCDFLRSRGHHVQMVTAFPYYPAWRKVPGDRGRIYRKDDIDGVWVHRCWHYVPRKVTTLRRIWHELSFCLTSFCRLLLLKRPSIYIVISPPLFGGVFAILLSRLKRRPFVFHVQDLQPDAAVGLGMVRSGPLIGLLRYAEKRSYRGAAFVSGISAGMLRAIRDKGIAPARTYLFPNWIRWYGENASLESMPHDREERARAFRAKYGIPADAFLVSYSGNLGRKQGLGTLLEAARLVQDMDRAPTARPITFVVVGDGAAKAEVTDTISRLGLDNVRLLPLLIERDYHALLAASNVACILQITGTGRFFFPSKLLSTLSVGTPVVASADEDSELASALREGKFGALVAAGNAPAMAQMLHALAEDPPALAAMAENTRWVDQFGASHVLPDFERRLVQSAYPQL